jgi:hypothetical protein
MAQKREIEGSHAAHCQAQEEKRSAVVGSAMERNYPNKRHCPDKIDGTPYDLPPLGGPQIKLHPTPSSSRCETAPTRPRYIASQTGHLGAVGSAMWPLQPIPVAEKSIVSAVS